MVLVVVDDLLVAYAPQQQQLYDNFIAAFYALTDVKEVGDAHVFAGITIARNQSQRQITLSQAKYAQDLVATCRYGEARGEETPAVEGLRLSVADCPTTDAAKPQMAQYPYRAMLYLSVVTTM